MNQPAKLPTGYSAVFKAFSAKDWCRIAVYGCVCLPIGFIIGILPPLDPPSCFRYPISSLGRGQPRLVQQTAMYTAGFRGLTAGTSASFIDARKRVQN